MTAAGELDPGILQPCLEACVEGFRGRMETRKFTGGRSNPTFRIYALETSSGAKGMP